MTMSTIQKWGNSHGVRLPKYILDEAAFSPDEPISIDVQNGTIIIKKAVRKVSIEDLFKGYTGEYHEKEVDFGKPVGEEVW